MLDEAALLWNAGIADRVRATHVEGRPGYCATCRTSWPCVMVVVAGRVGPDVAGPRSAAVQGSGLRDRPSTPPSVQSRP